MSAVLAALRAMIVLLGRVRGSVGMLASVRARTTFAFMLAVVTVLCRGRRRPGATAAIDRTPECVTRAHDKLDVKVQEVTFLMQP